MVVGCCKHITLRIGHEALRKTRTASRLLFILHKPTNGHLKAEVLSYYFQLLKSCVQVKEKCFDSIINKPIFVINCKAGLQKFLLKNESNSLLCAPQISNFDGKSD